MNYRHLYHAGNFTDVFKHIVLVALIQSLLKKDNAFCFIDTHAGIGLYDLFSTEAQKTKEFLLGIEKIAQHANPPELIKAYLACVRTANKSSDTLQFYPGSPAIVDYFLRPQDRMVLTELHEADYLQLKKTFPHDKQIAIHHQDGYQGLKAFLPPKERRGLVLIDPPYEKPDELENLLSILPAAVKRWETGIFALWYPIKERLALERFLTSLKAKLTRPTCVTELSIYAENLPTHLNGSGMIIVNPPWQLDQTLKNNLPWLWEALSPHKQGKIKVELN